MIHLFNTKTMKILLHFAKSVAKNRRRICLRDTNQALAVYLNDLVIHLYPTKVIINAKRLERRRSRQTSAGCGYVQCPDVINR